MQTKFKRHQKVKLLRNPDPEYVEYHTENTSDDKQIPITKGMIGRINVLLPNSQYHVEILDPEKVNSGDLSEGDDDVIAYVPMDEESLEAIN